MRHFLNALKNSRDGVCALLCEKSFRQELVLVAIGLIAVVLLRGLGKMLRAAPWGLAVLTVESLNSAIEKTVDVASPGWNALAKKAKDMASFACGAAITAFIVVCLTIILAV